MRTQQLRKPRWTKERELGEGNNIHKQLKLNDLTNIPKGGYEQLDWLSADCSNLEQQH